MHLTVELLRALGSPFEPTSISISQDDLVKLSHLSARNRMLFFYLHRIGPKKLGRMIPLYDNEQTNYNRTNDAIARAAQVLENAGIKHAFFKTIRPYTSTTVDLDILVFGENDDHIKSVNAMENAGYKLITHGPRSTTLQDKGANIGIDLYSEIAVSFITYMDKRTLSPFVTTTKLPNGVYVNILKPEADLSCIIAHSIIKEQMYTLSEYYTFIYYLREMNINDFLRIVKQNNIRSAARTHASMTASLYEIAHKTIPEELKRTVENLGEDCLETTRLIRNDFETPHKYHSITVAKSLLEIAKGRKSRNSMVIQIYRMLNPRFTKKFLQELFQHMERETY
jgi:hypothetical protein